jgi:superfamily II DNA helicase RecQ
MGKSLSFILPAYYSLEGTTIMVIPLVLLREDLYKRCAKSIIKSHI